MSRKRECNGICERGYPFHPDCELHGRPRHVGKCLACGSVEVELDRVTCHLDLSDIGESDAYPAGYGCEVCS